MKDTQRGHRSPPVDGEPSEARAGSRSRDRWIVAGLLVLLAASGAALVGLERYKALPGAAGVSPRVWPQGTQIEREAGKPALVAFAHPFCPCTRAALAELRGLSQHFGSTLDAVLLFAVPEEAPGEAREAGEWLEGGIWGLARDIPGLRVSVDPGGREARLFGAETSGHVVLYDGQGRLVFSGGITPSRGHVGDNAGLARVADWLAGRRVAPGNRAAIDHPVFGCGLARDD